MTIRSIHAFQPGDRSESGEASTFGNCHDCDRRHELAVGNARTIALEVMREFDAIQRLDYLAPSDNADPRLSFANLFVGGRGNMFGVLECEDSLGETVVLRAFSSLSEGIRRIDGWVPPILTAEVYAEMILPAQFEIKALTAEMECLDSQSSAYAEIEGLRKGVSQTLWKNMCAKYRFRNFRGEERSLVNAIRPGAPITGGMGECCAPKLLNHAARNGLRPLGLAEFYWGDDARSGDDPYNTGHVDRACDAQKGDRTSGQFYPSCEARCQPILGFMLCGLDT